MKVFEVRLGRYPPALYLRYDVPLMEVLRGMAAKRVRHCPLVDESGRLVGMVSARDLVDFLGGKRFREIVLERYGRDVFRALADTAAISLSYKPPFVYADSELREVVEEMLSKGVGALAVVDEENRLLGIVSERHVVSLFASIETHVKVKEVMTRDLVVLSPSDSLAECMRLMSEHRVRRVPLVSGGALKGIVTVKDVIGFLASESTLEALRAGRVDAVYSTPVAYFASKPVVTVSPEEDVGSAIQRMKEHGIGAVVVADGEKPLGILTERDLMSRLPRVKGVETFVDELRQVIYASRVSF